MTQYHAIATRDGDLWVVQIPGIGTTQGTDRDDAKHMARDYIATLHEIPIEDVRVDVTFREPVPAPWDAMVDAALEVIRRDSGYPSVAIMDRDMPEWRQQCEEIVTAVLAVLLGQVESPMQDDGRRCPRCNPDNTCTLWCLDAMLAEGTPGMVRELFTLRRRCAELVDGFEATDYAHLLDQYTTLLAEFNRVTGLRCQRRGCDHLESDHNDITGCEHCACPEPTRTPTG